MSITFNTPLGMWHMANYSFAISHAAGLEETSEKPAEPQQWYRERGEECKPCESKMRIQKSIEKKIQQILIGHVRVFIWATLERHERREWKGSEEEKNWGGEEAIFSKC